MFKQVILSLAFLAALSFAGNPNRILFGPYIVTYVITNDKMDVIISAKNNGWIAFGFGDSMVNSDIVTLRYDGTNTLVEDRYSTARGIVPSLDTAIGGNQDWQLVSGGFSNGGWDVTITRKLSTGDTRDTQILNGKRYDTLFAIGSEMLFNSKHKFFWEYEDIKYSDAQLDDQDGAAGRLAVSLSLITALIAYILI